MNTQHDTSIVPWDAAMETNIQTIGKKANGYKSMHIRAAQTMNRMHSTVMYTGIILGPMAGLLSGIGATLNPEAPVTFPIISACVAFISGIVVAVSKFGKYDEQAMAHKTAAAKYTSLESNVRRQLDLPRRGRENALRYTQWVGSSFEELFLASPLLDPVIYEDYKSVAEHAGNPVPEPYDHQIAIDPGYATKQAMQMGLREFTVANTDRDEKELIKRTNKFTSIPELNKFNDANMEYEMQRLMGFK